MADVFTPRPVAVFTTGGTIDKRYFDAKNNYAVGDPQIESILNEACAQVPYTLTQVFQKDSLDLTDEDRAVIAAHVAETDAPQVLITHGTDTMVETAQVLQPMLDKTVVLVGALNPARFKNSDAVFNIGFAMAAVQTLPPGVYIAMNGRIFDPPRTRKNVDANRFEHAAPARTKG